MTPKKKYESKKKFSKTVLFTIVFCIFFCTYNKSYSSSSPSANHIEEIIQIIKSSYIEDLTEEQIELGAISGIISVLDEYSSYFNKERYEKLLIKASGELSGLGLELVMHNEKLVVKNVLSGSNALLMGIEENNEITHINKKPIGEFDNLESLKKSMKGKETELTVKQKNKNEVINLVVKSSHIKIPTTESRILDNNIGYLKITSFSGQTTQNVKEEIQKFKKNSVKGIIMDLRNNSGGLLEQAIATTNLFLEKGIITIVKDKNKNPIKEIISNGNKKIFDGELIILANKGSASASEILISALQDNNRAIIIGEKTMGKGRIQNVFPLKNGSAIKLTTTSFYSPNNREINKLGIKPDIELYSELNSDQAISIAHGIINSIVKNKKS